MYRLRKSTMYRLRIVPLFCVLLIVSISGSGEVRAQATSEGSISGVVVDSETGEPLSGVHVFLASRLQGTTSGAEGLFHIGRLLPGSYRVVASIIGYNPFSRDVLVEDGKDVHIELKLRSAVYELDEVEVTDSKPREWNRNLKRFEERFLGTSGNAKKSEILNPYVLSFEDRQGVFHAMASEPLTIENRSLGYRLTFILDTFIYDEESERSYTNGNWYFEEMIPEDMKELEVWLKNREMTFKGSLQHLLWSMVHERTEEEGFSVLRDQSEGREYPEMFLHKYHPLNEQEILSETAKPHEYRMYFPDFIRVHYVRTGDRGKLFSRKILPSDQLSYLKMTGDQVVIHETGYMYDSEMFNGNLVVFGYLATLGVADMLPQEYALTRQE